MLYHLAVPASYPAGIPARNLHVKADIRIAPHLAELRLEETAVKILLRQGTCRSIRQEPLV